MGEMAEFFLSSQDDLDFYDSEGYSYNPLLTFENGKRYESHTSVNNHISNSISVDSECDYWVNKDAEIIYIKDMSDKYLNNIINYLCDNPSLMKKNRKVFENMLVEKHNRKLKKVNK